MTSPGDLPTRGGSPPAARRVVIAGAGVAGLEALLALTDLGGRRLEITVLSPQQTFGLRPQIVGGPWGGAPVRMDVAELCDALGAQWQRGTLTAVDAETRRVRSSTTTLDFDELLVATGAVACVPYSGVHVLGFGPLPEQLGTPGPGAVAIVVPAGTAWTLPAYELALLAATRSRRRVRVLTPEPAPLALFGAGPAAAVAALLADHGVEVETGRVLAADEVPATLADLVVALPVLEGPRLQGLPHDDHGFVPVDAHLTVLRADTVHAAGDVVTGAVKQGGLAAQQAEVAAADIVRRCGGAASHEAYAPVLRGKLTAGDGSELYLRRRLDGLDPGEHARDRLWALPGVLAARRLARHLELEALLEPGLTLDHVARVD